VRWVEAEVVEWIKQQISVSRKPAQRGKRNVRR
jgi:hypothetical protein